MALTVFTFRKTRATFDTSDTRREFGPVIIDFAKVQSKVSLKYDSWHKETLSKFGTLLSNKMVNFHTQISKSRSDLELQSIEAASTSDAVSFITYVQSLKRNMKVSLSISPRINFKVKNTLSKITAASINNLKISCNFCNNFVTYERVLFREIS